MRVLIISGHSKERILRRWILDGQADVIHPEGVCCLTRAMLDHA
jgi:hypothetical protein